MRVLGRQLTNREQQVEGWRLLFEQSGFQPSTQYIAPGCAGRSPLTALRTRAGVLAGVYRGGYGFPEYDLERSASRVADGRERIAFWGDAKAIGTVRRWIETDYAPSQDEAVCLPLGTATIMDISEDFSPRHIEMCRTGSLCRQVAAIGPILAELLAILEPSSGLSFARFPVVVALTRNCVSTATMLGGAAIHRMHVRHIRSSFWGVAPYSGPKKLDHDFRSKSW
jgi:hypothetical protein